MKSTPAWRHPRYQRYKPHPSPSTLSPQHLFTCELDGQELKTVDDCVAKLKRLDGKGRLWPQEMIMEVQRDYLVLSDIETKVGQTKLEEVKQVRLVETGHCCQKAGGTLLSKISF